MLTNEWPSYKAKSGVFPRIKPTRKNGAWELAIRYSTLNFNDKSLSAGVDSNITLSLSWYVNSRIRFSTNVIKVDTDKNAGDVDPNIL